LVSMKRNYSLVEGYLTIPQASELIAERIGKKNNKSTEKRYYKIILSGAKEGNYGAIKYGSKMYQVKLSEISKFTEKELKRLGKLTVKDKHKNILINVQNIIKLSTRNNISPESTLLSIMKEIMSGI
jgi:hypothetical protein